MSSLPRKTGGNVPGGLVAVAQQRASTLPSSQYLDAINVLCEANIIEACTLALSAKDYEETSVDDATGGEEQQPPPKSDYKKLLELEKKCRHAAKVVHREAIPAPSAMMPPSLPAIPAARVNLNPVAAKKSAKMGGVEMMRAGKSIAAPGMLGGGSGGGGKAGAGKAGVVPLRRGSMAGSRPMASNPNKRTMAQQQHPLHHSESDESSLGSERNGSNPAHKKARLAGSAAGAAPSDAPPPSALTFLKMLNKDSSVAAEGGAGKQTNNKGESKASGKDREKVTGDDNSDKEGGDKSDNSDTDRNPSSQREGTRKNPSRGARR